MARTATTDLGNTVSTTDLMTYDGPYKTDFDKFRDMSVGTQVAIVGCGLVTIAAAGYAIYKGVKYFSSPVQNNGVNSPNVNINGQYVPTAENGQPAVSFNANVQQPWGYNNPTPVWQPQPAAQPQTYTQKVVDNNGNVNVVPVNYSQPVQQ